MSVEFLFSCAAGFSAQFFYLALLFCVKLDSEPRLLCSFRLHIISEAIHFIFSYFNAKNNLKNGEFISSEFNNHLMF